MNDPPSAQAIHHQHRQRRAQLVLTDDRNTARRQERCAEDHPGTEPLVLLAFKTAVVVGDRVEGEILDELIEPDRYPCGPFEVDRVDAAVEFEDLARKLDAGCGLVVSDSVDTHPKIVELDDLHVTAQVRRDHREVSRDVEHAGVEVAHGAVPGVAQRAAHASCLDPAADAFPGARVFDVARDRAEGHAASLECVRHLRQADRRRSTRATARCRTSRGPSTRSAAG